MSKRKRDQPVAARAGNGEEALRPLQEQQVGG